MYIYLTFRYEKKKMQNIFEAGVYQSLSQDRYRRKPFEFCFCSNLQFMGLDVLPQSRDDDRTRLGVNPEESSESRIKLELKRLIIQQKQDRTPNILVT